MRGLQAVVNNLSATLAFWPLSLYPHACSLKRQAGEIGGNPSAEGATAPETLRQKDRRVLNSGEQTAFIRLTVGASLAVSE
jgi:hypothetical protein